MPHSQMPHNRPGTPGTSAIVTLLESSHQFSPAEIHDQSPEPVIFPAILSDLNGCILHLECPRSLSPNSALKIEVGQAIWLGSVVTCERPGGHPKLRRGDPAAVMTDGAIGAAAGDFSDNENEWDWQIAVRVTRVLRDIETLRRLAELFGSTRLPHALFRGSAAPV